MSLLTTLIYLFLFVGSTFLFLFWGPTMQAFVALREVKTGVEKLRTLREKSKNEALDYLIVNCKVPKEVEQRIEQTLEYFTIMPVGMDQNGLVGKVEHVVTLQDERMRDEIRRMAAQADRIQVSVARWSLESEMVYFL